MHHTESFLNRYSQNHKLPIRLISPTFGHLPAETFKEYGLTHRKPHYFFIFMITGVSRHEVDLQQFDIHSKELLFILPHQIHKLPSASAKKGTDYFKLGFDDHALSLLPKQYPFLVNPCNNQKIKFTETVAARLKSVFELMTGLLSAMNTHTDLVLAHLNSLLAEINTAYFSTQQSPADDKLSTYIRFKLFVENHLTDQSSIQHIAEELHLNTNSLYHIVKQYSGQAPKEYVTNRLILEAKRRLYYAESTSVKELAYELGFNDPEYFSRLFKKHTGKTISGFIQDLSGN